MEKIDLLKIKCIIWDLDGTLWKNSELDEKIIIKNADRLIRLSTEYGIVNSICSYNLQDEAFRILEKNNLKDFFVFPSINYSPKGIRIREIIHNINLTQESVLFIDDEIQNLKEAQFYNKGLRICTPFIIEEFLTLITNGCFQRKNRLSSYKILESKAKEKDILCIDNEEFLKYSNIGVSIKKYDSLTKVSEIEIDRILELANRANQLNFTKNRYQKNDLEKIINNDSELGLVYVDDIFGNYGLTGFYILNNRKLIDFVFSCRVINMGVEQYVYNSLGKPSISIRGDVASSLNSPCFWVNMRNSNSLIKSGSSKLNILFKGSCDFKRMRVFLPENIKYEVQYSHNGKTITYQTGIPAMAMTCKYPIEELIEYTKNLPFYSELYYKTKLFGTSYDIVFLSLISLGNLGVYKHKKENFFLGMGLPDKPMYLPEYQAYYSRNGIYSNGFENTEFNFEYLRKHFDYINDIYCEKYLIQHLQLIFSNINSRKVYIVLGNEEKYKTYPQKSTAGKFFTKTNKLITAAKNTGAFDNSKINIINISDFVLSEKDVMSHFNHFTSAVYYRLAKKIDWEIRKWEE